MLEIEDTDICLLGMMKTFIDVVLCSSLKVRIFYFLASTTFSRISSVQYDRNVHLSSSSGQLGHITPYTITAQGNLQLLIMDLLSVSSSWGGVSSYPVNI